MYRVLPNSTDKFREMIVSSMEKTNHNETWGRKLCFIGKTRDNSSRRQDVEPDEKNGQTNMEICKAVNIRIFLNTLLTREQWRGASVILLKEVESDQTKECILFMIEKHDEHGTKGNFQMFPKELHLLKYEALSVAQGSVRLVK
ncbi:hypothetical protein TNCV_4715381 [Trichonephila clavipes]|nr:hypothetical protein TNCV_4715381 [Trichonephila clavipes]